MKIDIVIGEQDDAPIKYFQTKHNVFAPMPGDKIRVEDYGGWWPAVVKSRTFYFETQTLTLFCSHDKE